MALRIVHTGRGESRKATTAVWGRNALWAAIGTTAPKKRSWRDCRHRLDNLASMTKVSVIVEFHSAFLKPPLVAGLEFHSVILKAALVNGLAIASLYGLMT